MARIEPAKKRGLLTRIVFWFIRRRLGKVPLPQQITAHHPKLLSGTIRMELAVDRSKRVPAILKDLAGVRVATLGGCPH